MKSKETAAAFKAKWSHPARGAWIEITVSLPLPDVLYVAPRKGCVD